MTVWDANLTRCWYHQDRLFGTYAMTDAAGNVAERVSYTAYGVPTTYDAGYGGPPTFSRLGNPFLFTAASSTPRRGCTMTGPGPTTPCRGAVSGRDRPDVRRPKNRASLSESTRGPRYTGT
jgi:hypothetical protein